MTDTLLASAFPPTPFALAIFFEISYHILPFSFFLKIMNNLELERLLNEKLSTDRINDYAPNGLQVEGKAEIKKIITGVTASQALIDYAVAQHTATTCLWMFTQN